LWVGKGGGEVLRVGKGLRMEGLRVGKGVRERKEGRVEDGEREKGMGRVKGGKIRVREKG
jgi:hypothetical protein